jgi:beta-glucosidase
MACGEGCEASVPVTGALRDAPAGEWRTLTVPLRCLAQGGVAMDRVAAPLVITAQGGLGLSVSEVRVASAAVDQAQCGQS